MSPARRIDLLSVGACALLLALGARLYALTGPRHAELRRQAERRQRRAELRPARRARILDRLGRPLAVDRPVQDVGLDLPALDPSLNWVTPLARALRITRPQSLRLLRRARLRAEDSQEQELPLGRRPLAELSRLRRALRRADGLRCHPTADGVLVLGEVAPLRLRRERLARLAALVELPASQLEAQVCARVERIHAEEDRLDRILLWREPLDVVPAAPFALVARVVERAFELPGTVVVERFARRYPQGDLAVHVIGHLGAPTPKELRRDREAGLLLDVDPDALGVLTGERRTLDRAVRLSREPYGRLGIEASRDAELRGTPGLRVVVRDVRNRERQVLADIPTRSGRDLRLTLDVDLQRPLELALDEAIARHGDERSGGAAVLLDLRDGSLLALASSPRFDPNTLRHDFPDLAADPRLPLVHRAVRAFSPGSTWKVLSALALTDPAGEAAVAPSWTATCEGRLLRAGGRFRCEGIHAEIGLVRALERSCNVYFFKAADRIGMDPLAAWAGHLGLGVRLVDGIADEQPGQVPGGDHKLVRLERQRASTALWAERYAAALARSDGEAAGKAYGRLVHAGFWLNAYHQDRHQRPGDARNAIIGQGDVLASPVQVAFLAGQIATGGRTPRPRVLVDAPRVVEPIGLEPEALARIRRGMRRVVTRGTASKPHMGLRRLDVAGKTGTAERSGEQPNLAWFMGYYPASAPEVAFAVLVDRSPQHGGDVCGPVAAALVRTYEASRGGAAAEGKRGR